MRLVGGLMVDLCLHLLLGFIGLHSCRLVLYVRPFELKHHEPFQIC